ncbi:uncharacterized protein C18orf63-like [Sphaeramia orbicularis]|uniref:uncharacterized protein C18orf63-like n=1 Tax=Sphaeramia orbicularis TaxID=375764 RepID=UPI00117F899B|nr:uncharacterized protein C18orf63-like [Sphaeramia orbicularis]
MSVRVQDPALFFLRLPDLMTLCGITLTLQDDEDEPRTKQIRTCRELVLLFSDVLASPALDSFTDISVVMAIPFFQKGVVQAFGRRHRLKVSCPQIVSPGVFQCCLSFSLVTRLSPRWNKAGRYLICGQDFLSGRGRLNAISLELSTSRGQMCFSIEANAVRLPPTAVR